jgi:hypothetical protein
MIKLGRPKESLEHRFWNKVDKTSTCWFWEGKKDKRGYGKLALEPGVTHREISAHRLSYQIHYGMFESSLFVCRQCDNPACVNPEHLFLGTNQDNVNDKVSKNRQLKGSQIHNSKLVEDDIIRIRHLWFVEKCPQSKIAEMFGIGAKAVSKIVTNKRWTYVKHSVE